MFAHLCLHARASQRHRALRVVRSVSPACVCLLLVAACTNAPPAPVAGAHPASHEAGARPAPYRPVIGPYTSQRPRDPSGWRENNDAIAPQEKP